MISHENIWKAIDRLAEEFGYSPSGLAKQAGLDPTSFNKSKRYRPDGKPRWPSTESIARILGATGSSMNDFMSLAEIINEETTIISRRIKLPVIGLAQAGRNGFFDDAGYPSGEDWNELEFPANNNPKSSQNLYAIEISGDSMEPAYRKGDILIVCPESIIHRGDRVVVKTSGGEVMAKEIAKQKPTHIELKSLNPSHENITLPAGDIVWVARIMWVSQ